MQNKRVYILDTPNEKQERFFKAQNRYIAYGGARGGGKSWAVRKKSVLLALNYPGIRILLLRRTIPQLRENHLLPLSSELHGIAKYNKSEHVFDFPNKSRIKAGYCDTESDVLQYQGQEYDIIFMDEATQFTEFQFRTLTACIRGANNFPKRMYLTCNPGGVGHAWVMRLFIEREYKGNEREEDYCFIPAKVFDNTVLMEKDPGYVDTLKNLPRDLQRAWLHGDWNVFEGQYFKEFDPDIHITEPFEIPSHWRKYLSIDYGLDMLAAFWIAVNPEGIAYVYRELYKSGLIISEAAKEIKSAECGDEIYQRLAPPDLWGKRQESGKSAVDIFAQYGLIFKKASNDRIAGWYELKEWLKPYTNEFGLETARIQIFPCCKNLIRTLPKLSYDSQRPNDVSSSPHELTHAPDAIRYFVSSRPKPEVMINEKRRPDFTFSRPAPHPFGAGVSIDKSYIDA